MTYGTSLLTQKESLIQPPSVHHRSFLFDALLHRLEHMYQSPPYPLFLLLLLFFFIPPPSEGGYRCRFFPNSTNPDVKCLFFNRRENDREKGTFSSFASRYFESRVINPSILIPSSLLISIRSPTVDRSSFSWREHAFCLNFLIIESMQLLRTWFL